MSKFWMTVCLPPTAADEVHDAIGKVMAPFNHNLSDEYNPNGEWDWWRIDAGAAGFGVRPEYDGDPRLVHCEPDIYSYLPAGRPALRCDGGPRGLLDFERENPARTALLTLDGEWVEARQPGSFTDVRDGEDVDEAFERQVLRYLRDLPDDHVVVGLYCHC